MPGPGRRRRGADGLTVVAEPLAENSNLCESGEDAMELMEDIARPNVKVMFDCGHVRYRRESLADHVHLMGADLHQIHIADTRGTRTRLPAAGEEDWKGSGRRPARHGFRRLPHARPRRGSTAEGSTPTTTRGPGSRSSNRWWHASAPNAPPRPRRRPSHPEPLP
ncbi:sugar phosphate isomerase/epimerase family protein [Lentzea sp. E54]|uniref:sugar phosphate isomerase/epimerase family protein n=1 Tax=Lentzea xerophila TaxID=3435883 RepID=UPI003DA6C412